ncbi:MAG: lipid-binding SYLF domain-containing protein [Desulfomonile tiedjei]|nr:lipid-binding SYLF domain-containing protein [Desulfomonile tiedjei]
MRIVPTFCVSLAAILFQPILCSGQSMEELDRRILDCNAVIQNVLEMPDRGIPKDLLQRCRGLAVFPGVLKVGVVVGVTLGNGLIVRRDENTAEWSRPAFVTIRGGSFGFQAGVQTVDLILLIMSDKGLENLLEDKITLGADVSVAAGPIGRDASAETNLRFDAGILSYSRAKGLFVGLALTGASLEPDLQANWAYHGKGVTVQDVLYEGKGALSDNARVLVRTLDNATK